MAKITLSAFKGENRALHPLLLGEGVGVTSLNQKPGRGDLRPWKTPLTVATIAAGRNTIYRMGRDVASDANYWLSWTVPVSVVRGISADDTSERTYWTGEGAPKWTNNVLMGSGSTMPVAYRLWGVPAPDSAPICTANSGTWTGLADTAFYVYTFVNSHGEESANSPVSVANTRATDATAVISGFAAAPSGAYDIDRIRLYRTQAGSAGNAEFFFLAEFALGTASYSEAANPTLGEVLPSATWLPPPGCAIGRSIATPEPALSNLISLWNGMLAGISGNSVRFCEAWTTYAWPLSYDVIPPDGKPVGLGKFGQSLLVLTTGRPLLVQGSSPDSMDQMPLEIPQGCVSARSIVSMGSGVAWASNDGLCWYGANGAKILTAGLMLREDWLALKPESIIGQMYEGLYFGSYSLDGGATYKGFLIDPSNPQGLYFLDAGYPALHFDELQDQLYVLSGASVQRWDAGAAMSYTFKSKLWRLPRLTQAFACAEVIADAYPVTAKFYADGVLKHTQSVTSQDAFRLPGGFYASTWQLEVTGANPVQALAMAHSMVELAQA